MAIEECEGLAAYLLDKHDIDEPVSPWEVAAALGVRIEAGPPRCRARVDWDPRAHEWVATVDPNARLSRLGATVVHEVAHPTLATYGLCDDEDHAWWLTAALLLPQTPFLREYRRNRGRVDLMGWAFPHVSEELVARRAVQLATSLHLWVIDLAPERRPPRLIVSPGWQCDWTRPSVLEQEGIDQAAQERMAVEPVGGVLAWPVVDEPWVRVLCVADGEVLAAQSEIRATADFCH